MKKQLVIIGILAILVTVGLSGCLTQNNNENQINNTINPENTTQNNNETLVNNTTNPEKTKFVGTWLNASYLIINFFSDGTCIYVGNSGTWDLKDGKLSIEIPGAYSITANYGFSNNNRTLSLTSQYGITTVYTKQ
jgi:hypothetical protein